MKNKKWFTKHVGTILLTSGILVSASFVTNVPFTTTEAQAATITTYTTTANLNLRASNETSSKVLLTIPKGKEVKYISKTGTWYKVSYGGKTGFVSATYIKKTTTTVADTVKKYTTTEMVNMRAASSATAKFVISIPKGKEVKYISKSGNWYKVSYAGKVGFVKSASIKMTEVVATPPAVQEDLIYTSTINLNVRAKNNATSAVLITIPKGKEMKYIATSGAWLKVSYGGKLGFVSAKYVSILKKSEVVEQKPKEPVIENPIDNGGTNDTSEPKEGEVTPTPDPTPAPNPIENEEKIDLPPGQVITQMSIYTTADLNFRKSDTTSSTIYSVIPANTKLTTDYKTANGWYKVSFKGNTGFVSNSYLINESEKTRITTLEANKNSYLFLDLRKPSSVTANQIDEFIKLKVANRESVLLNTGKYFIQTGEKYGVNALYLAAHAIHESGFGTSSISINRNNLFGYGAYDIVPYLGAVKFESIEQNIDFIGRQMKATYLGNSWHNQGTYLGYTVKNLAGNRVDSLSKGMNFYYASDSKWGVAIANYMESMLPYAQEKAVTKNADTTVWTSPANPNLQDEFPETTLALARSEMPLYSKKSTDSKVGSIPKGAKFNLTVKDNNYWLTVRYNGKTYFSKISFSKYSDYFTVKNLGRVTTSALNVREDATTTSSVVGQVTKNQFVSIVLDDQEAPVMKNGWYQIEFNGKTAWVSGSYITRELNR